MTSTERPLLELTKASLSSRELEELVGQFFGTPEKAERWLSRPKARFDWQTPRDLILAGEGRMVVQVLLQAENGFVS